MLYIIDKAVILVYTSDPLFLSRHPGESMLDLKDLIFVFSIISVIVVVAVTFQSLKGVEDTVTPAPLPHEQP